MNREWKPGDIADLVYRSARGGRAIRVGEECPRHGAEPHWHLAHGGWASGEVAQEIRPLVVIDPEDREQVERLLGLEAEQHGQPDAIKPHHVPMMQAALREFANPTPPPIDEPTARLTVVQDRNGDEWCHVGEGVWRSLTSTGAYMVEKHWHDRDTPLAKSAVRIVSEGVVA